MSQSFLNIGALRVVVMNFFVCRINDSQIGFQLRVYEREFIDEVFIRSKDLGPALKNQKELVTVSAKFCHHLIFWDFSQRNDLTQINQGSLLKLILHKVRH